MCLDIVKDEWRTGYKLFSRLIDGPTSGKDVIYTGFVFTDFIFGKIGDTIYHKNNHMIFESNNGKFYPAGFHVFKTLDGIKSYCRGNNLTNQDIVLMVKYKDVVASGFQKSLSVDVVRTIKLKKRLGVVHKYFKEK